MKKELIYNRRDDNAFDLEEFRKLCNNDHAFMQEMVTLFTRDLEETISQMENNLKQNKYDLMAKEAHKFVPSCRYMGAGELARAIKEIERSVENKGDVTHFPTLLQSIKEEAEKVVARLKTEMDKQHIT